MRTKRKRGAEQSTIAKRLKVSISAAKGSELGPISHNTLSYCYSEVYTLRQFLVDSLPPTSRSRRQNISTHTLENGSAFLDTTLVGRLKKTKPAQDEERHLEFVTFTQSQRRSTHSSNGTPEEYHLTEVSID
ncbi:hypothetical protein GJ744_006579 [Endocarpon pusillum]|uniref:Uncharacterized protein n=1 Tax=Endocarpon pusillum TaxID=364733 RepID=A0A8H7AZG0_9EURO|nr:hypothetical protein GJ744_006579 [Endocarpon pusillum]